MIHTQHERFTLHQGDNRDVLKELSDNSIDSIVTDPPYELGFMGKSWDASGIAFNVEVWKECLRVLKPGGHLLAFSGSRTYHRMAVAIEDAGFEIRDQIMWIYGSGFPKSLDVSKAIDKAAGAEREIIGETKKGAQTESTGRYGAWGVGITPTAPATDSARQWQGWGTALKPAHEPIVVARKPLIGTVAANVLTYGSGGLNIEATRVGNEGGTKLNVQHNDKDLFAPGTGKLTRGYGDVIDGLGRWPANVIHDGSDEVVEFFGEPQRFFYCAKASKRDRNEGLDGLTKRPPAFGSNSGDGLGRGISNTRQDIERQNHHPTVKPTALMQYLCKLVTPPGGVVLDPFAGSGSTGKAAMYEGFNFVGIELTQEYLPIAKARIEFALNDEGKKLL